MANVNNVEKPAPLERGTTVRMAVPIPGQPAVGTVGTVSHVIDEGDAAAVDFTGEGRHVVPLGALEIVERPATAELAGVNSIMREVDDLIEAAWHHRDDRSRDTFTINLETPIENVRDMTRSVVDAAARVHEYERAALDRLRSLIGVDAEHVGCDDDDLVSTVASRMAAFQRGEMAEAIELVEDLDIKGQLDAASEWARGWHNAIVSSLERLRAVAAGRAGTLVAVPTATLESLAKATRSDVSQPAAVIADAVSLIERAAVVDADHYDVDTGAVEALRSILEGMTGPSTPSDVVRRAAAEITSLRRCVMSVPLQQQLAKMRAAVDDDDDVIAVAQGVLDSLQLRALGAGLDRLIQTFGGDSAAEALEKACTMAAIIGAKDDDPKVKAAMAAAAPSPELRRAVADLAAAMGIDAAGLAGPAAARAEAVISKACERLGDVRRMTEQARELVVALRNVDVRLGLITDGLGAVDLVHENRVAAREGALRRLVLRERNENLRIVNIDDEVPPPQAAVSTRLRNAVGAPSTMSILAVVAEVERRCRAFDEGSVDAERRLREALQLDDETPISLIVADVIERLAKTPDGPAAPSGGDGFIDDDLPF